MANNYDVIGDKVATNGVQFKVRECPVCQSTKHIYSLAQRQVVTIPEGPVEAGNIYEVFCKMKFRTAWIQNQRGKGGEDGLDQKQMELASKPVSDGGALFTVKIANAS